MGGGGGTDCDCVNVKPQADAAGDGSCGDFEVVCMATARMRTGTDQLCELQIKIGTNFYDFKI